MLRVLHFWVNTGSANQGIDRCSSFLWSEWNSRANRVYAKRVEAGRNVKLEANVRARRWHLFSQLLFFSFLFSRNLVPRYDTISERNSWKKSVKFENSFHNCQTINQSRSCFKRARDYRILYWNWSQMYCCTLLYDDVTRECVELSYGSSNNVSKHAAEKYHCNKIVW